METIDTGVLMIRTSERTTFARCRQRWWWAYRDCLTPKVAKPALRFGDLVHQALALYYKPSKVRTRIIRGPHPAESFVRLYDEQLKQLSEFGMYTEEEEWSDARSLGIEMLENYVKHYGKDEQFQVIKPEVPFEVDMYDEDGLYLCTYVGQFDAVIFDLNSGKLGLFEHKTAKTVRTGHLPLDEQAGSYWAFAPYVMEAKDLPKLDFVLYNFLRKAKADDRPQNEDGFYLNKDGTVSKRQPSPLFHREIVRRGKSRADSVLLRVKRQAEEISWIDQGEMDVWKTPNQDCHWQCDFYDMCVLHEQGQDWESYRDATMTRWDPYAAHLEHPEDQDHG